VANRGCTVVAVAFSVGKLEMKAFCWTAKSMFAIVALDLQNPPSAEHCILKRARARRMETGWGEAATFVIALRPTPPTPARAAAAASSGNVGIRTTLGKGSGTDTCMDTGNRIGY
jgi:hypothetical protein